MRTMILNALLGLAFVLGSGAQEAAEVTEVDVLARLEEIETKLDDLASRQDVESTHRLRVGLPSLGVRYGSTDILNTYLAGYGSFEELSPFLVPFTNGLELSVEYLARPNIGIRLTYSGYARASLGLPVSGSFVVDEAYASDANADGLNDYYSYPELLTHELNVALQLHWPLRGTPLSAGLWGGAGLGVRRLFFADQSSTYWKDLAGGTEVESAWEERYVCLKAAGDVELRLGSLILLLSLGADYNISLGPWSPATGVTQGSSLPPPGIDRASFWLSIEPILAL